MERQFGKQVYEQALKLQEQGKDANQIAKILCDQDREGHTIMALGSYWTGTDNK